MVGHGNSVLLFSEFPNFLDVLENRLRFLFPKRHPMPIDIRLGVVNYRDAKDRLAFELGALRLGSG